MVRLNELSAVDAAKRRATREISAEQYLRACLERIDEREKDVRAFAFINRDGAIARARQLDAGAVLIMEVDGLDAGLDRESEQIIAIAQKNGAREVKRAATEAERLLLWKSRKQAFGAVGRLAPSYCTQDGVVPRTKLPHILRVITEIGQRYNLRIANVFHAGDGNIHPILLFDERDREQIGRVLKASEEILDECLACGGSVTGEHGIGVEKIAFMRKMFNDDDLAVMERYRIAFNPHGRLSPAKMLPTAGACGIEQKHPGRRAAL